MNTSRILIASILLAMGQARAWGVDQAKEKSFPEDKGKKPVTGKTDPKKKKKQSAEKHFPEDKTQKPPAKKATNE